MRQWLLNEGHKWDSIFTCRVPVTLAGCSEERGGIGYSQAPPCQLKKNSRMGLWRNTHANTHHHTSTAHSKLNYRYFSDAAAPTGDTESQTDSDWIHYYTWGGGGFSKLHSERGNVWETHTDHVSVTVCVMCLCVCVCDYLPPESISSRMYQGQRCRQFDL